MDFCDHCVSLENCKEVFYLHIHSWRNNNWLWEDRLCCLMWIHYIQQVTSLWLPTKYGKPSKCYAATTNNQLWTFCLSSDGISNIWPSKKVILCLDYRLISYCPSSMTCNINIYYTLGMKKQPCFGTFLAAAALQYLIFNIGSKYLPNFSIDKGKKSKRYGVEYTYA